MFKTKFSSYFSNINIYRFFTKKKLLPALLVLCVFSFLFVPSFTQASSWPAAIAAWLGGMILYLAQLAAQGFLALAVALLNFVASNPFKFSYTDPAHNPIIQIGWSVLRDSVNMFFILGLIYIGLATALRLSGFEIKKVFAKFLLVALIVNFTPLICGVIVDGCNILMNFFLKGYGGFDILSAVFSNAPSLGEVAGHPSLGIITKEAIFIGFGFIGGFVILLLAFLLLVRYVAIWVLTILSPLAFFAWIFPGQGEKWFEKWWQQFLNWSIIGIPAAFFLYLSYQAIDKSAEIISTATVSFSSPTVQKTAGTTFSSAIPYFGGLILLLIGLFASFQTSAAGAGGIIGFAKGKGKAALKLGGKGIGKGGKAIGTGVVGGAKGLVGGIKGAKEGAKEGGMKGFLKGGLKGAFTREGQNKGLKSISNLLEKAHLVRPGFYERMKEKEEEEKVSKERKQELEGLSTRKLKEAIQRKPITSRGKRERAEMVRILAERGKFLFKDEEGRENKSLERKLIKEAKLYNVDLSALSKSRVDLVPEINKEEFKEKLDKAMEEYKKELKNKGITISPTVSPEKIKELSDKVRSSMIQEAVEKTKPKAFAENVQPEAINKDVVLGMRKAQIEYLGKNGSAKQRTALEDSLAELLNEMRSLNEKARRTQVEEERLKELQSEKFEEIIHAVGNSPNYNMDRFFNKEPKKTIEMEEGGNGTEEGGNGTKK
ncbi:hypothetical protein J7J81_01485 [bacterium]|nr:hypothetical protein [bacterium]